MITNEVDLQFLFRRIEQRRRLSDIEKDVLLRSVDSTLTIAPGRDVVTEGSRPTHSTLLLSGLAIRYKILRDGRRQITAIHLPGDFVDLHGFPLEIMDHNVGALSQCSFAAVPHTALDRIVAEHGLLAKALWMLTLIDGAIHREWLVAMGALAAPARTAHLFWELYLRLSVVGLAQQDGYGFPISQNDLADVLGLSPVHMNRTLQGLRSEGLLEFQYGRVTILDPARVVALAQFDDKYLHLRDTI